MDFENLDLYEPDGTYHPEGTDFSWFAECGLGPAPKPLKRISPIPYTPAEARRRSTSHQQDEFMKLTQLWKTKDKPTISFELFPARTDKAANKLEKVIDKLAALTPDLVSVTFGAGGSTREGSRELVRKLKHDKGLEVIAYFAGYGLSPSDVTATIDAYCELGVDNVLLIRGDKPEGNGGFTPHPEAFDHATDLLSFLRPHYDVCMGAAGYPEGHQQAQSREKDFDYLKMKVDCGAEYIVTQYCYDNRFFVEFMEACRKRHIDVPIVAGVMPIFSVKMMEDLAALCGATITDEVRQGLAALPEEDKGAVPAFGVDFAIRQCEELLGTGVAGIHIYTIDRAKAAMGIVPKLREKSLI